MAAICYNHVSLRAINVDDSVRFYETLFAAKRLKAPNFGIQLAWLQLGDSQLHLFERDCESNRYSHFGVEVDNFEDVYYKARDLGAFDTMGYYGHHFFEVPSGELQLYLRDPAANLLEVVRRDSVGLPADILADVVKRADRAVQSKENMDASLFA